MRRRRGKRRKIHARTSGDAEPGPARNGRNAAFRLNVPPAFLSTNGNPIPFRFPTADIDMRNFRPLLRILPLAVLVLARGGDETAKRVGAAAVSDAAAERKALEGTWKGFGAGAEKDGEIVVTIVRDTLRFHRDTNFWFETTFVLPAGKDPRQLHATIRKTSAPQGDSVGQVVRAFYRIRDDRLTLATMGDDGEETSKAFDAAGTRFELRKSPPAKKEAGGSPTP